ncbi:helix-turn-helix domain-containing protein [Nocardioides sp. CER19]|uniref:helix-turn-helix domain-containing protein n=1 Tax=Nocardioides sp. CER19 TaxID=3038538 RepID=UPI00244D2F01|nr:helix-turn-helix domain-containing protein [Nocardioides sp. CER19]MDH2416180.1 helix-turn-helix domain-containing protein [Nocardioides sp. CER19]
MSTLHTPPFHERDDDELLTFNEVAEILRVPINTLRWWRQLDQGPRFFKIGRQLRTTVAEVRTYLDAAQGDLRPLA